MIKFSFAIAGFLFSTLSSFAANSGPKVLMIVAHPDDEYFAAATTYRITHNLNGIVDQIVLTDGRDGYHFSMLAESFYHEKLTEPKIAAEKLPAIRRKELEESGKVLGIREHFFLNHPDQKCATPDECFKLWGGKEKVKAELRDKIIKGHYDFIFTLLPTDANHLHHKASALAALEVVNEMNPDQRPVILASSTRAEGEDLKLDDPEDSRNYLFDAKNELSKVMPEKISVDRNIKFGFKESQTYQIIVSWMIAAHKSQGMFQTYFNKHRFEDFRIFTLNSEKAAEKARALFKSLP